MAQFHIQDLEIAAFVCTPYVQMSAHVRILYDLAVEGSLIVQQLTQSFTTINVALLI